MNIIIQIKITDVESRGPRVVADDETSSRIDYAAEIRRDAVPEELLVDLVDLARGDNDIASLRDLVADFDPDTPPGVDTRKERK